jgi:3-deoxy-7-phosphoheptulonate synthase
VISTRGNRYGHIVLRGGKSPNYDAASIALTEELMKRGGVTPNIIVDCSHGNSNKDFRRQASVFNEVLQQIENGSSPIIGWMIESNLREGRQDLGKGPLQYGVSITDACISYELTESLLTDTDSRLRK